MAIQLLRGFRDFYPEDQAKINFLHQKIAETCTLFGYEEFEGPALEPFELYSAKSSDEIVSEQAFSFEDRSGERIVLRPELTPTLARMIASRQNQLAMPIRWWSFGRFWRYERPQKGRGREFYQWNCDLMGDDSLASEVEILEVVITFLQSLGLTSDDIVIEVNDRSLVETAFSNAGINPSQYQAAYRLLDRSSKLTSDERETFGQSLGFNVHQIASLLKIINELQETKNFPGTSPLTRLTSMLEERQLSQWIQINCLITRGFNYYTGFVFEVSDRQKLYRSLLGGGRYSNLVAAVGGEPVSGIGFGMGDMVLLELLQAKGLLTQYRHPAKAVLILLEESLDGRELVQKLRQEKISFLLFSGSQALTQGLRFANRQSIPFALIIGSEEIKQANVTLKTLATGEQAALPLTDIIQKLK